MDSKPELQRVLEHRRRNQLIKKKKEELEAKRLQCPFEQELLKRQQRLSQVGGGPQTRPTPPPRLSWPREELCMRPQLTTRLSKMGTAPGVHPWPESSLCHSLCCVTLGQWLPLSEPQFPHGPNVWHADSDCLLSTAPRAQWSSHFRNEVSNLNQASRGENSLMLCSPQLPGWGQN